MALLSHIRQNTRKVAEQLVAFVLEAGESPKETPKEFLKKIGKPKHAFNLDWEDWEELQDWQRLAVKELAAELGADWDFDDERNVYTTDLELNDDFSAHRMTIRWGRQQWLVFEDDGAARTAAIEQALEGIDEGIFGEDFLSGYINDEQLRRDLRSDVEEGVRRDFEDTYSDDEMKRDFFRERDDIEDEECMGVDEDGDEVELPIEGDLLRKIESLSEDYIDSQVEEMLEDPIHYLQDIFGEADGLKQAMEIGGIDRQRAAEDAVDNDGAANFLASYDYNETSLDCGAVAFRQR